MKISRNSWHARVYSWWYREKHGYYPSSGVNLCPYVRAVLFWAHLRFLFLTKMGYVTWTVLAAGLEYTLLRVAGWKDVFTIEGAVLLLLAIAGTVIALGFGVQWLWNWTWDAREAITTVSFVQVLKTRAKAGHNKICPFMEFTEEL